jgi:hypothetical protein
MKHVQQETLECNKRLKLMKYLEHTLATYVRKYMQHPDRTLAACNMKHLLQQTIGTDKIFGTYCCNICVKHMQHPYQNA